MQRWRLWGVVMGLLFTAAVQAAEGGGCPAERAGEPGKLKMHADSTTYSLEEGRVQAEQMVVRVLSPCGEETLTLSAPRGTYEDKTGVLGLSGTVLLSSGTLRVKARGAVFETGASLVRLDGPLRLERRGGDQEEPFVITATAATVNADTGAVRMDGPIALSGQDLSGAADRMTGNFKDRAYTLCCDVTLHMEGNRFQGKAFTYFDATGGVTTSESFTLTYRLQQKPAAKKAPPPPKATKGPVPVVRLDIREVTLTGTGLRYDGKTRKLTVDSAVQADFGGDNGGGTFGALWADLGTSSLTMQKGVSLTLGATRLEAREGTYLHDKETLTLSGQVHLWDTTEGKQSEVRARRVLVHFRPGGTTVTLTGEVQMEMTVDTGKISGSVNL